jgi:hypothetical protein
VRTAHRTGARGYAVQSEPRRVESNPSGVVERRISHSGNLNPVRFLMKKAQVLLLPG